MPRDPKKRQKQLTKKAAKRRAALAAREAGTRASAGSSDARQVALAAKFPIYECLVPELLFEIGIGNVIVTRTMLHGNVASALFLVDVFCLGIKDVFFAVLSHAAYADRLVELKQRESFNIIRPTCARKLVEGAEAYARDLGFSPHPDYHVAKKIFGEIDAQACPMSFEFGKDGKPFFVAGPYDTPARCQTIMDTLMVRCGPDGFHYLMEIGRPFDEDNPPFSSQS